MNTTALVVKTIKESGFTIQYWADELGIHRNQIHRWLSGSVKKIRNDNLVAVGKVIGKKPKFTDSGVEWINLDNKQIQIGEIKMSVNAEKIIENQQTVIELLKQKIEELKNDIKNLKDRTSGGYIGDFNYIKTDDIQAKG